MSNNNQFRPIVGIDLGTINSAVAYIHNGRPEIIAAPNGERLIPSVVLINMNNQVVIGEDARAALVAMPERSISAIKRQMGSQQTFPLAGQYFLPEEISAFILKELKMYVEALYGEGEKEAVITVPAYFTDEQRRATKKAGELAGFVVERIINEPTAAALAFGLDHTSEDGIYIVYDLGGGTFDVSIIELMDGIMEVKASTGNPKLGGEDFDWKLVDLLGEHVVKTSGVDPRNDMQAKALLKEHAEKIKKQLGVQASVLVELPLIMVKDNKPVGISLEITREQFITLIDEQLQETMDSIHNVLKDARLTVNDIDDILLVGGSTRIPRVQQLIGALFNKEPRTDINPDEAVALGAAVQAGLKSGALSHSGLIATDIAPFSMGIEVLKEGAGMTERPGGFAPIIAKNTAIPVTRKEKFSTVYPGQTAVAIKIYQGEHEWVKLNHKLGEFLLEGLPENFEQLEDVEVTFRYNLNGILEVSAKSLSNEKEMKVVVQDALQRESKEALKDSYERLESLWTNLVEIDTEEDWEELDDMLGEIEEGLASPHLNVEVAQLKQQISDLLTTLDASYKQQVQQLMDALDQALAENNEQHLQKVIDDVTDALIDLELEI